MSDDASLFRRLTEDSPLASIPVVGGLLPGLLACAGIGLIAYLLRMLPGLGNFSPMIIAIALGIIFGNTFGISAGFRPGIAFSMRRLLRAAIVLLGLQLTFFQVADTGLRGVAIIVVVVTSTFFFTLAVGRLIGADERLTRLIAAGTSICGASAVAAANSVVAADDEDVAYAVACVTVFGSIAMFGYPLIEHLLVLAPRDYGLWAGSSIHEIAQVVAATFTVGHEAGEFGTVAKLTRVMTLAPMVFLMAMLALRRSGGAAGRAKAPFPWFVVGFVAMVGVNSLITIHPTIRQETSVLSTFLLTMALAAMGLETNIAKLRARGVRPALLGAIASLFIAGLSLTLIKLT